MNYIDVKNFRKYEQLFGDNGPAKIGHVNAVIKALNEGVSGLSSTYAPINSPIFTGTVVLPSTTSIGTVSSIEISFLSGVTSNIQSQLDSKAPAIITINRQTSSYILQASDANKMVEMNVGSANNLTVNANVFTAGQQLIISQYGAGQTSVVAGPGMTIRSNGGKLKLAARYSGATLVFLSATEAYLFGDITL